MLLNVGSFYLEGVSACHVLVYYALKRMKSYFDRDRTTVERTTLRKVCGFAWFDRGSSRRTTRPCLQSSRIPVCVTLHFDDVG